MILPSSFFKNSGMPALNPGLRESYFIAGSFEQEGLRLGGGVGGEGKTLKESALKLSFPAFSIWKRRRLEFTSRITCSLFLGKTPKKPHDYTNIKQTWRVVLELRFPKAACNTLYWNVLARLLLSTAFRNKCSEPGPEAYRKGLHPDTELNSPCVPSIRERSPCPVRRRAGKD